MNDKALRIAVITLVLIIIVVILFLLIRSFTNSDRESTGQTQLDPVAREELYNALENNDYNAFNSVVRANGGTEVSEQEFQEMRQRYQNAREQMQQDTQSRGTIESRLFNQDTLNKMSDALKNKNYDGFKSAISDGITEETFNSLAEAYNSQ